MTDDVPTTSPDDTELLAELGRAIAAFDSVPDAARIAAHGLLSWRSLDDELAELRFDSALDAASVRGLAWPRQLSFEASAAAIEVEVDDHHLVGQVVPPAAVEITLTSASGTTSRTTSDAVGHFRFDDVGPGAVRISASWTDGSITTQWFSL
jgi:hypothetical protein